MRAEEIPPRTWLLAAIAGWALLVWLLAVAGLGRKVLPLDPDPSLQPSLPQLRPSPPERLRPFTQYAEIAARPLFADDRRPKPFSLQPEGEESSANAFDFILTSVLLTPRLKLAILQPSAGGDSIRIKLGESAEQAANWRLVSVEPRSAVFEGPGGQRTLELRAFDGTSGQPATPSSQAAGGASRPGAARGALPNITAMPRPPASAPTPVPPASRPQAPSPAPNPGQNATAPQPDANAVTPDAQIEAIRQRIQARREQLRREAQQTPPANNP